MILNELPHKIGSKMIMTPFLLLKRKDKEILFDQAFMKIIVDDINELTANGYYFYHYAHTTPIITFYDLIKLSKADPCILLAPASIAHDLMTEAALGLLRQVSQSLWAEYAVGQYGL